MPRNFFSDTKIQRVKADVAFNANDIVLALYHGRFMPLPDSPGAIILQDQSSAGNVLVAGGTAATAYIPVDGESMLYDATTDAFYQVVYQATVDYKVARYLAKPDALSSNNEKITAASLASGSVPSAANAAAGLARVGTVFAAAYSTAANTGLLSAINPSTLGRIGAEQTSGLGGPYGIVQCTRSGTPHVILSGNSAANTTTVKCFPVDPGTGVGAAVWTFTLSAVAVDSWATGANVVVSPDGTKVMVHAGNKVALLNISDGTQVGATTTLTGDVGWLGSFKLVSSNNSFLTVVGLTSTDIRIVKLAWADASQQSYSAPAALVGAITNRDRSFAWHYAPAQNKLIVACGGAGFINLHEFSVNATTGDIAYTQSVTYVPSGGVAATNAFAHHLHYDDNEGVLYLVFGGTSGGTSVSKVAMFLLNGYSLLKEGASFSATATYASGMGKGNNGFLQVRPVPIGGIAICGNRLAAGADNRTSRHLAPVGRAPYGVALRSATKGSIGIVLRSGQALVGQSIVQTGFAVYDATSNTPAGVKLTVNNGVGVMP